MARSNRLEKIFINKLEEEGLVDIEPIEIKPTWVNNWEGVDGISK
jgi:hypothetical protein